MPILYGNANYRKKFDAFRIVDQSGHEPLKEAIDCALKIREVRDTIKESLAANLSPDVKAQLVNTLAKSIPDEFFAWIKVAEFLYAKPRHVQIDGNLTFHTEKLAEEIRDGRQRIATLSVA